MNTEKRQQLTLFVENNEAELIEKIRGKYNPEQFRLIAAHVTLCREDEIENIEKVVQNLEKLNESSISIDFGNIVRFSNGRGVLLPALNDDSFQKLRKKVLEGIIQNPRVHQTHITLMHPRNSTCTDAIFEELQAIKFLSKLSFNKISLIEQEKGKKWEILREYPLNNA